MLFDVVCLSHALDASDQFTCSSSVSFFNRALGREHGASSLPPLIDVKTLTRRAFASLCHLCGCVLRLAGYFQNVTCAYRLLVAVVRLVLSCLLPSDFFQHEWKGGLPGIIIVSALARLGHGRLVERSIWRFWPNRATRIRTWTGTCLVVATSCRLAKVQSSPSRVEIAGQVYVICHGRLDDVRLRFFVIS